MKKITRLSLIALAGLTGLSILTACGGSKSGSNNQPINIITREDGSGTRSAFIELFGIEEKSSDGKKVDHTTQQATVTNSTAVMLTTVADDKNAIGYASLGSVNNKVKVLKVDGTKASAKAVKDGSYKISRPFNIVTKDNINSQSKDFINYILSEEGQKIVEDNGYISDSNTGAYKSQAQSGKIVIAGSSSVTPVMEKLKEAYVKENPNVTIEIQQSDSTTGVTSAIDETCDIGMASRELDKSETDKGVKSQAIALDGIAIIVNKNNKLNNITSDQVKAIYTGKTSTWGALDK
ncbi:substrate-binding domain-containing protein [Streptococcus tangpeifui]|uniref:substrate-binding domain-containing protein n=1 Tax=Streptococcus tangpeifui TaxID=2709400 RepID=UPI0013EE26A5|nr:MULTISPECIES: substrate-binding domain-containing protein [unclassified Streptococcus]